MAQGSPAKVSLNGTWRFAYAPDEVAAKVLDGFQDPSFAASAFKDQPVPSNWALQGYEEPTYKKFSSEAGQGFYIKRFSAPASWSDKRVRLRFDGVWSSAEVWVNGKPLGRHDSGFTGFGYDITSALKPGRENVLAVRVRQTQHDYEFDTNDDWTLGGIYRDVDLEVLPKDRWIDGVQFTTTFDDQFRDANLKLRVMVADTHKGLVPGNYVGPGEPYELRVTLLAKDGSAVQSRTLNVPAHYQTGREIAVDLQVQAPLKWTAETPDLYDLRVQLVEAGKVVQERVDKVGFRQISTAGGVFRINGQAVKLRGVNRHDEHPDVGRATTPSQWREDIELMKAANINFIRLAHYPPAKGFLDLCDEMGVYVGDEISMGYGGDKAHDPAFTGSVMLRSQETVARDINHPSVIFWSIGNEDPLTALHMASVRTVKGLDPSRPVLLPWRADLWLPPEIDILAPHYLTAQENSQLAAASDRPVITTEFTHAYGDQGMGGLEDRWKALVQHPAGAGGAIWMWADQGLKAPFRQPDGTTRLELKTTSDGWDGIVDAYRKPTRDYWEAKAVYAQVFPAVDRTSFIPGQPSVGIPIQNDFDFTDLKTVRLSWTLMEDDRTLASGDINLAGQPHAAALLDLPIGAISTIRPGATYYAWISALRPDGSEISRRTVELVNAHAPPRPSHEGGAPIVSQGAEASVEVGGTRYVFSPRTGELISVQVDGRRVLSALRPTVWRPLNPSETPQLDKATLDKLVDLDKFSATASSWSVKPGKDVVRIEATTDYVVDAQNRFKIDYVYEISADGRLSVRYGLTPSVKTPWLTHVGMRFDAPDDLTKLRWLGLGPLDAYPNEKAAAILGVWSGGRGQAQTLGVKATRWVELADAGGQGLHIDNEGYVSTSAQAPGEVDVLSAVVGRPSKGRRPEKLEQQLNTAGARFLGEFVLAPLRR